MASYDQTLLKDTEVTKGQRQEGYNIDLLHNKPAQTPPTAINGAGRRGTDPEQADSVSKEYAPAAYDAPTRKLPFYRTTKGVLIIVIAAIVVLAAVIGGAVGGTRHHKNAVDIGTGTGSGSPSLPPIFGSTSPGSASSTPVSSSATAPPSSKSTPGAGTGSSSTSSGGGGGGGGGAGQGGGGGASTTSGGGLGSQTTSACPIPGLPGC